jgi:hypothetical protein
MVRYATSTGLYYMRMEMPGVGAIETGVKDGIVWERSDLLGPRIKTGVERAEALRESVLNSTVEWRTLFPKVQTTGLEMVNGEECFRVEMTPAEGFPMITYFSKNTGLARRTNTKQVTQMGEVTVDVMVLEYRQMGDLLVPSKLVEKGAGQELTATIQRVESNPEIPPSRFDFPADVKALLDKQK